MVILGILMDELKLRLITKAKKKYGKIFPCINKSSLEECFTESKEGELIFWFNTPDNSTHMIASENIAVYDVLTVDKLKKNGEKLSEDEQSH